MISKDATAETVASPQEVKAQELYAQQVEAQADAIPDPGLSNAHRSKAARVRNSLPVCVYLDRLKRLAEAHADVPSGYEGIEMRAGYAAAVDELQQANSYSPLLLEILTSGSGLKPDAFLGLDPTEADIAAVDAANVILGVGKARVSKPVSRDQVIAKAIRDNPQLRSLNAQLAVLRKDLDAFKAEQEAQGVRFL